MHQNKYNGAKTSRKVIGTDLKNKLLYTAIILAIPVIALAYPFTYETCNLGYTHVHIKTMKQVIRRLGVMHITVLWNTRIKIIQE